MTNAPYTKSHSYKGLTIYPCESAYAGREGSGHNGKWIIQSHHSPTGMPLADEICAHFWSLAEARERIDAMYPAVR